MNKFFAWLEDNAIKTIITVIIAWGLFFSLLYIRDLNDTVSNLQNRLVTVQESVDGQTFISIKGMMLIIEQLSELRSQNYYIVDQNSVIINQAKSVQNENKRPSYEELKAHTVFIIGCAGKADIGDKLSYPIGKEEGCWSGTGSVIKVTDTETYILTNNHVAGFGVDVNLYVENDKTKVPAVVVANHSYADAAVIKISGKLIDKTPIQKISSVAIQDKVFVVGHPLGVKNIYTEGIVAGYEDGSMLIQMPCIYGNSGSAIFNQDGELVGLVFALEMYHGWMGIPEARITHTLAVEGWVIEYFLTKLGLYNE
jgi:S1-C subfamily serine protease